MYVILFFTFFYFYPFEIITINSNIRKNIHITNVWRISIFEVAFGFSRQATKQCPYFAHLLPNYLISFGGVIFSNDNNLSR